jgi:putative hydrolase of the HAD superfamily
VKDVKVVGFDADDTLWENENHFQEAERRYAALLGAYAEAGAVSAELLRTETANIALYGYGVKSFTLSMLETAVRISRTAVPASVVAEILSLGKGLLTMPVILLPGVEETLSALERRFRLVLVTKGDLVDQEGKLARSGLAGFFHHVEIVSEKDESNYRALLRHLDLRPEEFLMVGNSLKSDILPVLGLGGYGIHVPFHTLWQHEKVAEADVPTERFLRAASIREVPGML